MSTRKPVAAQVSLRHGTDEIPGIARARRGRGFSCIDARGHLVRDPATLSRIRALATSPAWAKHRRSLEHDLGCACLCKRKVLATVVALMERAQLRGGDDEHSEGGVERTVRVTDRRPVVTRYLATPQRRRHA